MECKFSVLISIYIKEKAIYFHECMESILKQTVLPNEIVIVEDGPLTDELYKELDFYKHSYPELIVSVKLEKNKGLGLALAEGILHCSNELIARMDTDDICVGNRFELQLEAFKKDAEVDIMGGNIIEFSGNIDNVISRRNVPSNHKEIVKYQKLRSAFNHVTVMFRKSAVLKAGNYKDSPLMEDDQLWVDMIMSGSKCKNIDTCLVYVRTGADMIKRRGSWGYFKRYKMGRKKILKTGFISWLDYLSTIFIQFIVCNIPTKVRLIVFRRFLR